MEKIKQLLEERKQSRKMLEDRVIKQIRGGKSREMVQEDLNGIHALTLTISTLEKCLD